MSAPDRFYWFDVVIFRSFSPLGVSLPVRNLENLFQDGDRLVGNIDDSRYAVGVRSTFVAPTVIFCRLRSSLFAWHPAAARSHSTRRHWVPYHPEAPSDRALRGTTPGVGPEAMRRALRGFAARGHRLHFAKGTDSGWMWRARLHRYEAGQIQGALR